MSNLDAARLEKLGRFGSTMRAGAAQLLSEGVATFGLIGVVIAVGLTRAAITPFAVAAYIRSSRGFARS